MKKFVVYTAITHGYDVLKRPPDLWRQEADFVAFLDWPQPNSGWQYRPIYRRFKDPCRNAKIHKILAHRYFPDAECSLWIDGSIEIKSSLPFKEWTREYLAKNDLAVFRHRFRNCIYKEAFICLQWGLDSHEVINCQMRRYFDEKYPINNGLAECTVLLRRHNQMTKRFNDLWYDEIKRGSRRDQLSFNYITYKLKLKHNHFPGYISDNPHFKILPHEMINRRGISMSSPSAKRQNSLSDDGQDKAALVSMIFLYYDNPQMLQTQLGCWSSYAGKFNDLPEVLLIDDGSPRTRAEDIVRRHGCGIPIKVFRIKEDIPWNFSGARNLGCHQARNWIYISDIDTLLSDTDAKLLFEGRPLSRQCFYIPKRVWLPNLSEAESALVNLLFHKDKYIKIGGYDEDYSGHYGREETDFYNRLKGVASKVFRKDVLIRVMPPHMVVDSRTITSRPRDKTRNVEIYARKETVGFANPVNPLRFAWERVL